MRGERVKDAGSRFARPTDLAGVHGRLVQSGSLPLKSLRSVNSDGTVRPLSFLGWVSGAAASGQRTVLTFPRQRPRRLGRAAVIHKPAGTFDLPGSPRTHLDRGRRAGGLPLRHGQVRRQDRKVRPRRKPVRILRGSPGPNEHQGVHFEGGWFTGDAFRLTCPNGRTHRRNRMDPDQPALEGEHRGCAPSEMRRRPDRQRRTAATPATSTSNSKGRSPTPTSPRSPAPKSPGTGTCYATGGADGAPSTNKLDVACGDLLPDRRRQHRRPEPGSHLPSQRRLLTTCCPGTSRCRTRRRRPRLSALRPADPLDLTRACRWIRHPFEFEQGHNDPVGLGAGGLYTRSQEQFAVHACGVAVDGNGDLVVAHGDSNQEFAYFDKLGLLPWAGNDQQEGSLLGTLNSDTSSPCRSAAGLGRQRLLHGPDRRLRDHVSRRARSRNTHPTSTRRPAPARSQRN